MTVVVQDQPSIWAWLGPILLFAAAMITLWVTNWRADKREWNKWRRDTLVKVCSDAVAAAREAGALYESALDQKTGWIAQTNLNTASRTAARIGTISEQLYLMNANYLADTCAEMRAAADAINTPMVGLRASRMNAARQEERELKEHYSKNPSWFGSSGGEINPAMQRDFEMTNAIRQRIHEQTLAQPEAQYNEAREQLEAIRLKFLERGRIELKSTS